MSNNKIDISIIVPIYNTDKYLSRCIKSLISQTKRNIEFILINDGSTDDSEKIIKSYEDKRIKYYKNKNQGIGKTRNFGIKKSTGKYIMFVDSDDYISKECCEELFKKAEEENADLIVTDYYKDIEGQIQYFKLNDFKSSNVDEDTDLIYKINTGPCNKIYKRSLVIDSGAKFSEQYKYEDTVFVMRCVRYAQKICKINKAYYYYCIHSKSETTVRDERVFDILEVLKIVRSYYNDKKYRKSLNIFTMDILTNYTIQQRYQKDKKIRNRFIDACFDYMKGNIINYKNKIYYQNKSYLRRKIESSKIFTKIYCNIANKKTAGG